MERLLMPARLPWWESASVTTTAALSDAITQQILREFGQCSRVVAKGLRRQDAAVRRRGFPALLDAWLREGWGEPLVLITMHNGVLQTVSSLASLALREWEVSVLRFATRYWSSTLSLCYNPYVVGIRTPQDQQAVFDAADEIQVEWVTHLLLNGLAWEWVLTLIAPLADYEFPHCLYTIGWMDTALARTDIDIAGRSLIRDPTVGGFQQLVQCDFCTDLLSCDYWRAFWGDMIAMPTRRSPQDEIHIGIRYLHVS